MRVDHLAYQRATNVAALGFLIQAVVGTVLLVLGLAMADTATIVASIWSLIGLIVWVGLLIVFHQHRQERLEALEADELLQASGDTTLFDGDAGVASRRLRLIYKWLLPLLSFMMAAALVIGGWQTIGYLNEIREANGTAVFEMTEQRGWLVAVSLSCAVVCFIFSRFLAGMAEHDAWRNLRGGAGVMVGNAIVYGALAVGVVLRFFDVNHVVEGVAWGTAIFMCLVAIEIVLAIVLNVYRPRVAGEFPRAAFDSRSLSLAARPDSFVRSLNEAVNYQFGFDITSSWGYQLLLRSGMWLGGLSIVSLLVMSMFVVVDGREAGLRLRSGAIVETGHGLVQSPGAFWKWPWPLEYASLHDVTEVRSLPVTPAEAESRVPVYEDWSKLPKLADSADDLLFVVRPSRLGESEDAALLKDLEAAGEDLASDDRGALIRARIVMNWRVQGGDSSEEGLLQFLDFGSDLRAKRQRLTDRERMLRGIALGEATRQFAKMNLDQVLMDERANLGGILASAIQSRLDTLNAGIEVMSVDVPIVAPPEKSVMSFEDLPVAIQQADREVARAQRERTTTLAETVGDTMLVDEVVAAVDKVESIRAKLLNASEDEKATLNQELEVAVKHAESLIRRGGGQAYQLIASAERGQWIDLLSRQGQSVRVRGQQAAWQAAPALFRERALMAIYGRHMPSMRKYVSGVEADILDLSIELRELASPNTVFSESLVEEIDSEE